jgi:hypothetical protein
VRNLSLESPSNEAETQAVELAICVEAGDKLSRLWEISSSGNKQGLSQETVQSYLDDLDTPSQVLKSSPEQISFRCYVLYCTDRKLYKKSVYIQSRHVYGSAPYGIRTRVLALRGLRPGPLDEWDGQ